ncbi:hypothetical protein GJU40_02065 [Bacillus lacus]|uniref:YppF-like protein n=1 Tax=Metabacillus lacus TaxID=1983721 RepID=A0A7X2IW90_9BACI|nr:YppF family protein [Metabacillus lacus]MRX70952.1 hypothetical protein [Metabacillus lacus]
MKLFELEETFFKVKAYRYENLDQLMDFTRLLYLKGKLNLSEYRQALKQLESNGATLPETM